MYSKLPNSKIFIDYDTAKTVASNQVTGWRYPKAEPADEEIEYTLSDTQSQILDLVKNETLASAATNCMVTGVIGKGLKPQSNVDFELAGITQKKASEFAKRIEAHWNLWSEGKSCSFDNQHNFWELENLVFRSSLDLGDTFVLKRFSDRSYYKLALQPIESILVDTPVQLSDRDNIQQGIEKDRSTGAHKAYYIGSKKNAYTEIKYKRIPAHNKYNRRQVLHLAHKKRLNQTRGTPFLQNTRGLIKQLSRYTDGEAQAAVLNSFLTFVTHTRDGLSPMDGDMGVVNSSYVPKNREIPSEIKANTNIHLFNDEKVEMFDPKRPSTNYEGFATALTKFVGAELEIPFEVLLSHFSSSYSASRAALQKAYQVFNLRRKWLVANFHQKVWEWFVTEMVASQVIDAPGFFRDPVIRRSYCQAEWLGDTCLQLDPVKEAKGASALYELGIISKKSITRMLTGQNYDQVVEQLKREQSDYSSQIHEK